MTRLDHCDTIPMTVQNIMLEHMREQGMSQKGANDALADDLENAAQEWLDENDD